jgi:hypothetical protein
MSDRRGIAGPNHKDRRGTPALATRLLLLRPRGAARAGLLRQQVGALGEHPRPAHAATARVCELSHIHRPSHVGVAMTEEKRDLVDAFAGQEGSARDRVPEAMHRRELAVLYRHWPSLIVLLMKHWERRVAALVSCLPLRCAKGSRDVPLAERPPGACAEHKVARHGEARSDLVLRKHESQLSRDRHRACRSVRLRRLSIAVTVDLIAKLELGLIEIVKSHVCPGQREQFREAGTGQSRDREQCSVRLPRRPNRLL